ncbi:hypothetical protein CALVIDRAFT_171486 [Calocera viscosa TUFC12733]|uniref:Uncharacterized protein n=1 Tax=Calocera viscosa (strain TUFC12733) TaxID=1330018 RepID=A0A167L8U9_CALVF|nr:hypothetical protein CALVIDRAFT_171486 [Calocera viscosa TUFC12733]
MNCNPPTMYSTLCILSPSWRPYPAQSAPSAFFPAFLDSQSITGFASSTVPHACTHIRHHTSMPHAPIPQFLLFSLSTIARVACSRPTADLVSRAPVDFSDRALICSNEWIHAAVPFIPALDPPTPRTCVRRFVLSVRWKSRDGLMPACKL